MKDCRLVSVRITLFARGDRKIRKENGRVALRRRELIRISHEALQEDVDPRGFGRIVKDLKRTIQYGIAALRKEGVNVPTRGYYRDTGRGPSHKAIIVGLWLKGYNIRK